MNPKMFRRLFRRPQSKGYRKHCCSPPLLEEKADATIDFSAYEKNDLPPTGTASTSISTAKDDDDSEANASQFSNQFLDDDFKFKRETPQDESGALFEEYEQKYDSSRTIQQRVPLDHDQLDSYNFKDKVDDDSQGRESQFSFGKISEPVFEQDVLREENELIEHDEQPNIERTTSQLETHLDLNGTTPSLRRSSSHDSFSTLTTAIEMHQGTTARSREEQNNISIVWGDNNVSRPPTRTVSLFSSTTRSSEQRRQQQEQLHRLYPNAAHVLYPQGMNVPAAVVAAAAAAATDSTMGTADGDLEGQQQGDEDALNEHSEHPLSPEVFASFNGVESSRERPTLRRTHSGGLDPYLKAPERFTRFEI